MTRRVLITGGSRGIGRACVERFCAAGHEVAFFYRERQEEAKALAARTGALAFACDVSEPAAVRVGVAAVICALGGLDILVNNAGIAQIKLMRDITDEDFRRMIDTNLTGAFTVSREAQGAMIGQQWGRIVNIGSMWGKTGASCEVHYSAAKAGIRGLTMAMAKELGPSGITVNCVEPGVIDTEMNASLTPEVREELTGETPLCRLGKPEEVAAAVAFFVSDEASFITGQILGVDGGFAV